MNIATAMANGLVSELAAGAEFLLPVVASILVPAVPVPLEPEAALVVEAGVLGAVAVPLGRSVPDDEREDDEGDGLGQELLYTNWAGSPLQEVADPALNVPFG